MKGLGLPIFYFRGTTGGLARSGCPSDRNESRLGRGSGSHF
jgi:hypothetical protein